MEPKFEILANSEVLADLEAGVLRKAIAGPKNPNFKALKDFDKLVRPSITPGYRLFESQHSC